MYRSRQLSYPYYRYDNLILHVTEFPILYLYLLHIDHGIPCRNRTVKKKMMKSARRTIAILLLSHMVGCAFAHSYFVADLKAENGTSIANAEAFIHDGEWTWEVNSTLPLSTAGIVDRRGDAANPEFTDLVDLIIDTKINQVEDLYQYQGTFDDSSIEVSNKPSLFKEERNMTNALQLAGHMCMGHIFVLANTTEGFSVHAPLMYSKDGDCYEGTKTTTMRMPMGGSTSSGTDHSHAGEDTMDHDNSVGHSMVAGTSDGMLAMVSWSLAAMTFVSTL